MTQSGLTAQHTYFVTYIVKYSILGEWTVTVAPLLYRGVTLG